MNDFLFYLCCQYIGFFLQVVKGFGSFIIIKLINAVKMYIYLGGKVPNA